MELCLFCGQKRADSRTKLQKCFRSEGHEFTQERFTLSCAVCGAQFKPVIQGQTICGNRSCLLKTEEE